MLHQLNALLDAAVDAMILIGIDGRITRFNHAAERMFGYAADEVLGRNVHVLMPEPYHSEHDGYIRRYLSTGERRIIGFGREVTARRKDGSTFPVELSVGEFMRSASPLQRRSEDAEEHGFVGILRDISLRREREAEANELRNRLAHVGRIGTLGEMVSGIAHEVNQPLTAIAAYASGCRRLLQSGKATPNELAEPLDKIAEQAERAGQVIRGLRQLVRRGEGVRERLEVNHLVREVARLLEFEFRQCGFRLELQLESDLAPVTGDPVQIQQVVLNLVRNAMEAMLEQASVPTVLVETRNADAQTVEIQVLDHGPGIRPAVVERLYEPFFTTKPQGFGLGLSICKSIVAAHGGALEASARPEGGAVFSVRLPVNERGGAGHD